MIYLDNNATLPLCNGAKLEIENVMKKIIGNPSSQHWAGRNSSSIIEETRYNISKLINGKNYKIIFTGSGSESNNIALNGLSYLLNDKPNILISPIEHPSVWKVAENLSQKLNWNLKYIPINYLGEIEVEEYRKLSNENGDLAIIQWVNHEVGTIQDIVRYSIIAHRRKMLFHCDAVQAFGKIEIDMEKTKISTLSLSGHKIGAPQGIAILAVHKDLTLQPMMYGGNQENKLRPGTQSTLLIAGLNGAIKELIEEKEKLKNIRELRNYLKAELSKEINGIKFNGVYDDYIDEKESFHQNSGNCLSITIPNMDNNMLSMILDMKKIAVSRGSACESGAVKPSKILLAMGLTKKEALSTIRVSLSKNNNKEEIGRFIKELKEIIGNS